MRAAKWLGVAPWDLLDHPSLWFTSALDYEAAESDAADDKRKMADMQGV